MPARAAVDHLILAHSDLDAAIAWVEQRTGVRPAIGGSHPGRGTRNALLALGGRQYLEIMAPDPAQPVSAQPADVRALQEPTLIGWAASTPDIEALASRARGAGQRLMGPRDGSRVRPDGRTIRWRTLNMPKDFAVNAVDPIPFFIVWSADSVHPSQDSPSGCELQSFDIEHPDPRGVKETLARLGIDADVTQGASARLIATLRTPNGIVTLGGPRSPSQQRQRASGSFEVKLTPQSTDAGAPEGPALARMSIEKQFSGDLQGTSSGEMLTATGSTFKDSAGYVAVERVSGTLHGRKGTFALQHSGTMSRGAPQLTISVVPDTGTGELTGIAGTMSIRIDGRNHYYEFDYAIQR